MTNVLEGLPIDDQLAYREYRAPKNNGESVEFPPRHGWSEVLAANLDRLSNHSSAWQDLRSVARQQMHQDALQYTKMYRDVDERLIRFRADQPVVAAGHQPTIFHPGVWFKNFALSDFARSQDALAINVVVDNDVASGASIRVPKIDQATGRLRRESVPFDQAGGGVPFEETSIQDYKQFDTFDQRVIRQLGGLTEDACVTELWTHARKAYQRCSVVSCVMAQSRHALEGDWGLQTLELPLSVLARSESFTKFVSWILSDIERFSEIYNRWTLHYRRLHGIRSNAHPVPLLGRDDGWWEAPFWIYDSENPQRRGVWLRRRENEFLVADAPDESSTIMRLRTQDDNLSSDLFDGLGLGRNPSAAAKIGDPRSKRIKFRPRALITTMFLRWVHSDLFLHGIGGGKYDQLCDQIAGEFFSAEAPEYAVLSATVTLTPETDDVPETELQALNRQLRDLRYQPERFADRADLPMGLVSRKIELIADSHLSASEDWFHDVDRVNRMLSQALDELRSKTLERMAEVKRSLTDRRHLTSREHPFCIFSREHLQASFKSMLSD